ncbi:MAG: SRPBCC domain-containing protein [Bacteroidota bacterium]
MKESTVVESFDIHHDLQINTSPKKVFDAISMPKHLINWWPEKCTGKPGLNSEYNFHFTDEYNWYGKVSKCEPNTAFHIKMTKADEDWNPTSFGFDLIEDNGKALVKFWHRGWPECNDHFRRSSFCWALLLKGLKDYVEKNIIIPFEERS